MERFDGILVNLKDLEMSTTLGTLQGNEEGDVEDEEGSGGYVRLLWTSLQNMLVT